MGVADPESASHLRADPAEPVWVEALYDLDLEIISLFALSERSRLSLVLAPGIASDFLGVTSDQLTFQGAALLTRETDAGPVTDRKFKGPFVARSEVGWGRR